MNILGVGGAEFALILIIMLIVAGPKRMLHWAYILGKYMAQLRQMWSQMMDVVQKEFDEAGVDFKVPKDIPTRGDVTNYINKALQPVQKPLQEAMKELENETGQINEKLKPKTGVNVLSANSNGSKIKATASKPIASDTETDKPETGFGTWSGIGKTEDQE